MSLADELLADFGSDVQPSDGASSYPQVHEINGDEDMDVDDESGERDSVHRIAKLHRSSELREIMEKIHSSAGVPGKARVGPMEADPEYQLIARANQLAVDIDTEIGIIHKYVRDKYSKRFPELENLIQVPLDYIRTVKAIGNDVAKSKSNEELTKVLLPSTIMIVCVAASTTAGERLSPEELKRIEEACDVAVELNQHKLDIYEYVKSKMYLIAPNLSSIVGSEIAAKLMGVAGGLRNLSTMPASNLLLLGSQKRGAAGFTTVNFIPHTGFLYYSQYVQDLPKELRQKAARQLAGKCALAARVDAFGEDSNGTVGSKFKEDIDKRVDKWQEPPPVKAVKALPVPLDAPRKKRGGRRARKEKERLGQTEMRKAANRVTFAEIEEDAYQDAVGYSVGQLGKAVGGRIRGPQVDNKTQVRISKTLQKNLKTQQTWGGTSTVRRQIAGTASSVAFTPYQGIEIVNPLAAEASGTSTSNKYFASTAQFIQVKTPLPNANK